MLSLLQATCPDARPRLSRLSLHAPPPPGACQLSLELVVEERCNAHLAALWPINANRNRALMLAASPAVLLADVDFVVGGELSPWLRGAPADATAAQRWRQLLAAKQAAVGLNGGSRGGSGGGTYPGLDVDMSDAGIAAGLAALAAAHAGSKNSSRDDAWLAGVLAAAQREGVSWLEAVLASDGAVVLPAFQPTTGASRRELRAGAALALAAARGDKRRLAALAVAQPPRMAGFQQDKYPRGHRATRYWWWLQARQPYAVDYWQVRGRGRASGRAGSAACFVMCRFRRVARAHLTHNAAPLACTPALQGYEPFLLMATAATPLYDERFRWGQRSGAGGAGVHRAVLLAAAAPAQPRRAACEGCMGCTEAGTCMLHCLSCSTLPPTHARLPCQPLPLPHLTGATAGTSTCTRCSWRARRARGWWCIPTPGWCTCPTPGAPPWRRRTPPARSAARQCTALLRVLVVRGARRQRGQLRMAGAGRLAAGLP